MFQKLAMNSYRWVVSDRAISKGLYSERRGSTKTLSRVEIRHMQSFSRCEDILKATFACVFDEADNLLDYILYCTV